MLLSVSVPSLRVASIYKIKTLNRCLMDLLYRANDFEKTHFMKIISSVEHIEIGIQFPEMHCRERNKAVTNYYSSQHLQITTNGVV